MRIEKNGLDGIPEFSILNYHYKKYYFNFL